MELNLLMALQSFKRYDDCLDVFESLADIPGFDEGGAYILAFALTNWSSSAIQKHIELLEKVIVYLILYTAIENNASTSEQNLIANGSLTLQAGRSFTGEITRLQRDLITLLPAAQLCASETSSDADINSWRYF